MRVKWIMASSSVQLTPVGTRVSVYAFKCSGASSGTVQFRNGGAGGDVKNFMSAVNLATEYDALGGSGNWMEFSDGVYVTITGTGNFGILVQDGSDGA